MPSNNPNAIKNLKHFSSTYRPAKAGRKPNILKKWITGENSFSKNDIASAIQMLMGMSRKKLQETAKDENQPVIICYLAMTILGDISKKNAHHLDTLMKYAGFTDGLPSPRKADIPEPGDDSTPGGEEQFTEYQYPALPEGEGTVEDIPDES
jgi:peroxiredoxin family protein